MPLPALAVAYLRNQLMNGLTSNLPQNAQTALKFMSSPVQTAIGEAGKKIEEGYGLPYGLSKIVTDPKSLATDYAKTKALDTVRGTENESQIERIIRELQAPPGASDDTFDSQASYMPDTAISDTTQTASLDNLFNPQESEDASFQNFLQLMATQDTTPFTSAENQAPIDFGGTMNYGDLFNMDGGRGVERETSYGDLGGDFGGGGGDIGGGGCPAPWVNILMADGGLVKAGEIKPGMQVYTRHETTNEWGVYPVTAMEMGEDERWEVALEDGRTFVGTFNHRVHTNDDWTEIRNLKAGDKLVQPDGFGIVKSSQQLDHGPIVKITVGDAHTYISEGFLSHNIKYMEYSQGGQIYRGRR